MKHFRIAVLLSLTPIFIALALPSAQADSSACAPYRDTLNKIYETFRYEDIFRQLDLKVKVRLSSNRLEGHLANMTKNLDNWFSADNVTLNISEEFCDLKLSKDAFSIAACHEFGHVLGGQPYLSSNFKFDLGRIRDDSNQGHQFWSSEGQSDYWATLKCVPTVWEDEDNQAWLARISPLGEEYRTSIRNCNAYHGEGSNRAAICIRAIVASTELAKAVQQKLWNRMIEQDAEDFKNGLPSRISTKTRNAGPVLPAADFYDPKIVSRTNRSYPSMQCRLDTYIAGAFCPSQLHKQTDFEDLQNSDCLADGPHPKGARPSCWYKPKK